MSTRWLVLPTLNEVGNLDRLVAQVRARAPELFILVVDDRSSDGTAALADRLAAGDPQVHVLHREGRAGYGEALTAGFRRVLESGAEAVGTMDCDFSHDPKELPALFAALDTVDVAIGSRYVPGGGIRNWPAFRRLLSLTANTFVRALFRLPVRDCTSGYRAYRRQALEVVPLGRLHSAGYSFLVEALYWICRAGLRPVEVPIVYVDRTHGDSKMGLRQIVAGAANLLKVRMKVGR
jgi:glycosyltransferase involved in cell wall biosynthesis